MVKNELVELKLKKARIVYDPESREIYITAKNDKLPEGQQMIKLNISPDEKTEAVLQNIILSSGMLEIHEDKTPLNGQDAAKQVIAESDVSLLGFDTDKVSGIFLNEDNNNTVAMGLMPIFKALEKAKSEVRFRISNEPLLGEKTKHQPLVVIVSDAFVETRYRGINESYYEECLEALFFLKRNQSAGVTVLNEDLNEFGTASNKKQVEIYEYHADVATQDARELTYAYHLYNNEKDTYFAPLEWVATTD